MMETGIVKSLDGLNAKVVISRREIPCGHCTQETCTIPDKGIEMEAINIAGAKVGQKVRVVMDSYTFIKGVVVLYILPLIALIGGAIVGKMYLASIWQGINTELLAAIGGFLAFFASLILIKILSGRMEKKTEHTSVIESIVEE